MAKLKIDTATLDTLAGHADLARQQVEFARARFAAAATGIGSGFGDSGLAAQYERGHQHALTMAEHYAALLDAHAKLLRAAAEAYRKADRHVAGKS